MKVFITVFIIVILIGGMVLLFSNCQTCKMAVKDFESDTTGIERIVTLYDADGDILNVWEGKFTIDTTDGIASFNLDGKRIILSGTYTVIEK